MAANQPGREVQPAGPHYRAYLVRLWRDSVQEPWRASAQSVQSGEMVRFATLHELFAFLDIHLKDATQLSQTDECSSCDEAGFVYHHEC